MAEIKRIPVFGSKPPCADESRRELIVRKRELKMVLDEIDMESKDIIYYDSSDEEYTPVSLSKKLNSSYNVVDYLRSREYGLREYRSFNKYYSIRHVLNNSLLTEFQISLKMMSKIVSSQWLNSKEIIYGTQQNEIMVYDVNSCNIRQLPSLKGCVDVDKKGSIDVIELNSSRSLLLTSAYSFDEMAIYKLSTLDPYCVTKGAHNDIISNATWLDNNYFVSASKDKKVAIWNVKDICEMQYDDDSELVQSVNKFIEPSVVKHFETRFQPYKMIFNKQLKKLVTFSEDKYVSAWDIEHFKPTYSKRLTLDHGPNFCIGINNDGYLCTIGCGCIGNVIDSRALHTVHRFDLGNKIEIMSISIQDNIITIGTNVGVIWFFDVRAGRFLLQNGLNHEVALKTSRLIPDSNTQMPEHNGPKRFKPKILTHCYDYTGIRLFAAGEPPTGIRGSYAGVWQ